MRGNFYFTFPFCAALTFQNKTLSGFSLSHLCLLEDCGHGITLKVTDAPSHFEARGRKMLVADVLVSGGVPVLTPHVPQPLLQSDRVLQREPESSKTRVTTGLLQMKCGEFFTGNEITRKGEKN